MQLYLASRIIGRDDDTPPPYRDNELPEYTEEDPYSSLKEQQEGGVASEDNESMADGDQVNLIEQEIVSPTAV